MYVTTGIVAMVQYGTLVHTKFIGTSKVKGLKLLNYGPGKVFTLFYMYSAVPVPITQY